MFSCNSNGNKTKEKELELKEKELSIREQELNFQKENQEKLLENLAGNDGTYISTENKNKKSNNTIECGEKATFIGTIKYVDDKDIIFNSERKSYYIYFTASYSMLNSNNYEECGEIKNITYCMAVPENNIDLKKFVNQQVKVNGIMISSPTMHYNTNTYLRVLEISSTLNRKNNIENWGSFINKFKKDVQDDNFSSIINSTSKSFNGYTDAIGGISIAKWLSQNEYLEYRKRELYNAINGKIIKKGNTYYTGGGYAGDYYFKLENNKWKFKGYIIIDGE